MTKRLHLTLLAAALLQAASALAADDLLLPEDNRMKVLMYDETDVYTITTKYGYQTNIVFAPQEEIQTISVGDRSLWQIIPSGNRLFIRPMDENVTTNMTILTNRHSYQFDLHSLAGEKEGAPIYVAKFIYPEDKKNARRPSPPVMDMPSAAAGTMAPPAAKPAVGFVALPPAPVTSAPVAAIKPVKNYNYTYTGPDALAPTQVFDDGKSTFIQYHTLASPLPKLYVKEAGGKERLATYYTRDTQIVIEEVASEMLLKYPTGAITIYNEILNPE